MKKRLIIIDVSNFIFRAFYAIRTLHSPDGTPVNAVHGVLSMFMKLFSTYRPTHILVAKDTSGGTFRNEIYEDYKGHRPPPPEDLVPQFALIQTLIEKIGLTWIAEDNYEADDIMGAVATQWKDNFDEILIASGDKDLMQFVGDNVFILDTMKDIKYDRQGVFDKMGVWPEQIVDYLSIVGDSSDNIPGMKGIGAKGAAKLLEEHKTLEACIEAKDTFKGKKLTNAFENHLEDALLSKKLVQIVTDLKLGMEANSTEFCFTPTDDLIEWLKGLGFKSAIKKLEDIRKGVEEARLTDKAQEWAGFKEQSVQKEIEVTHVTEKNIKEVLSQVEAATGMAFHTEYDSRDFLTRDLVGISVSIEADKAFYFSKSELKLNHFKDLYEITLCDETKEICSSHVKEDYSFCKREEISFKAQHFDVIQAHFVLDAGANHGFSNIVKEYLDYSLIELEKKNPYLNEKTLEEASAVAGERAASIYSLSSIFKEELKAKGLESVYYEIDDNLFEILNNMEYEGIHINKDFFSELEEELAGKLTDIETEIKKYCDGEEINLNSPKQVGQLLFEKLELPVVKKTKTGYSTDAEVLEELSSKDLSPVPALILQNRELSKLQSTYVKALPLLINEKTGRLHTTFDQHVAATGRLASNNPNLQNIPIRTEMGRKIRKGFMASPGNILLACDYSQVELRLLAHFSEDETMLEAFKTGIDIHSQTASEVMGIPLEEVTSSDRSKAKAVNFGLMYGQSSFGLAKALKITRREAKEYITNYFQRFSSVKAYLDSLKEVCEQTGYAITLNGRKRFLPDIHSKNRTVKSMAERMAVNSPIQGTAADILKIAMIKIDSEIKEKKLKSKMLLQVHDELIFEVPEDELTVMKKLVVDGMENIVDLKVPLKVDMGIGVNWFDLK
ncbi:MAG: DNA polymerase-1 [Bacteriovoracaceae bacterium]|jgi:DNA polymerase-1